LCYSGGCRAGLATVICQPIVIFGDGSSGRSRRDRTCGIDLDTARRLQVSPPGREPQAHRHFGDMLPDNRRSIRRASVTTPPGPWLGGEPFRPDQLLWPPRRAPCTRLIRAHRHILAPVSDDTNLLQWANLTARSRWGTGRTHVGVFPRVNKGRTTPASRTSITVTDNTSAPEPITIMSTAP
jgi:hypothetical protein